jgi:hypothetical protein
MAWEDEDRSICRPVFGASRDPKIKALVNGLQDQVNAQGLWANFFDGELGRLGYGQLELGLLNENIGCRGVAPRRPKRRTRPFNEYARHNRHAT